MEPRKLVWWKVIVGFVLMLSETLAILNRNTPAPNVNRDQLEGMYAMQVILVIVGLWLVWSGTKPFRR